MSVTITTGMHGFQPGDVICVKMRATWNRARIAAKRHRKPRRFRVFSGGMVRRVVVVTSTTAVEIGR